MRGEDILEALMDGFGGWMVVPVYILSTWPPIEYFALQSMLACGCYVMIDEVRAWRNADGRKEKGQTLQAID